MAEFYQQGPSLTNQFIADRLLKSLLKRKLPKEMYQQIEPDLIQFGERVVTDLLLLANQAEISPPTLMQYDAWGVRVDEIGVSAAWKIFAQVAAEEGIIAIGYERAYGEYSRLYQFAKCYLFHPSSAIYTCPLAMSDGAARVIELYGDEELKTKAFRYLTTRNPSECWTSGQWMTEKTGGSDVSGTETEAKIEAGQFKLYGTKWFTSATTAQMAMVLARTPNAPAGGKGLSLFYIETRNQTGRLNHIQIHRLKDKLGTKALPTAELSLLGTPAKLIGDEGHGVKKMSSLFNITRAYNANCAVASMRRMLALARDYATKRSVFGKLLSEQPLHLETLAQLQVELEAGFHLNFYAAELLGKEETGKATVEECILLRLLLPLTKLFTAKQAIHVASETLEAFGGAGYIENTGLPHFLRDAQVLSIWEGTTNVLSLDVFRAIEKENAFNIFVTAIKSRLSSLSLPELTLSIEKIKKAMTQLEHVFTKAPSTSLDIMQAMARQISLSMARCFAALLMLEHAEWSVRHDDDRRPLAAAIRWCAQDLLSTFNIDELNAETLNATQALAMDYHLTGGGLRSAKESR